MSTSLLNKGLERRYWLIFIVYISHRDCIHDISIAVVTVDNTISQFGIYTEISLIFNNQIKYILSQTFDLYVTK